MKLANPVFSGFNPDPSVVRVERDGRLEFVAVTSTFEYMPGIPVYRSDDLIDWELVGHVITRVEQFDASDVPTNMGNWAPTIRYRDGLFFVIVAAAGVGTKIYTAPEPNGPWSDGTEITGLNGIDPDIAWDDDGTCYVTFSGLVLSGPEMGRHLGIQQARVDPVQGTILEPPRTLWSGTGGMFPEAPHLYHIGDYWYLVIAEGGTERGHSVSVGRSTAPGGPFDPAPHNPIVTARGTDRPVQNTGHGDLVLAPDGTWSMLLLGVRTRGLTRSFSALGRETFGTHIEWVDDWPHAEPVELTPGRDGPDFFIKFSDGYGDGDSLDTRFIGVRRLPSEFATIESGQLVLHGVGTSMSHLRPTFVGRRQSMLDARISAVVDANGGVGGISIRYDEQHHYDLELNGAGATARVVLPTIQQSWSTDVGDGPIELVMEMRPGGGSFGDPDAMTCDTVHLIAVGKDLVRHELAAIDGRFLSSESACSFTGRVVGMYAESGVVRFAEFSERRL